MRVELPSLPSRATIKARATSLSAWKLPKQQSALAPDYVWSNKDMDPVPEHEQTWSAWTWLMYWAVESFSLGAWQTAGSLLKRGLSWREAFPAVSLDAFCISFSMFIHRCFMAMAHAWTVLCFH